MNALTVIMRATWPELWEHWREAHRAMTREAFIKVLNDAADRVIDEMWWDDLRERDAINLMINTFGAMLDNPDVTVDEVMAVTKAGQRSSVAVARWKRP